MGEPAKKKLLITKSMLEVGLNLKIELDIKGNLVSGIHFKKITAEIVE